MTTATTRAPAARKSHPVKKVDLQKLSDKELMALDEKTYLASLSPKMRKLRIACRPLRGIFDKELAECE